MREVGWGPSELPLWESGTHRAQNGYCGGGSVASVREKGTLSCCYSSFLWKEHHRLPPQQTLEPSQEAVSPEFGECSLGRAGVGRGEALVCEPAWAADGKACSSVAASLCHC